MRAQCVDVGEDRLLHRAGIRKVVLCVGYRGEMIEHELGDGSRYGVELTYSSDGPSLLGTGGALKKALPLLFFLCFYNKNKNQTLVCLLEKPRY